MKKGARENLFLLLLSLSLVLAAVSNYILIRGLSGGQVQAASWILYGLVAIAAGLSFILKKDIPRNIGLIALAIFLVWDGINVVILAYNSDFPLFLFALNGILAVAGGIFFILQRETWKNPGFILLSGYLLTTGAAGLIVYTYDRSWLFLGISSLFAIPAAVIFFLRKA